MPSINTTPPVASQDTDTAASSIGSIPVRTIGDAKVPFEVLRFIPEESAQHYRLVPLAINDSVLEVGMVDPDDIHGVDALNFIARVSGMPFKVFKISEEDFKNVLTMYRGLGAEVDRAVTDLQTDQSARKASAGSISEAVALDISATAQNGAADNGNIQEDAPTIKIVSTILRYAIDGKASDIHIEPMSSGVRVRYRVDGDLHTSVVLPVAAHRGIVARIKVLSSIRLDESRKPQDGRFSATVDNRPVDFRVSTFPSYNGEKIVIRILDREQGFVPLKDIGLSDRNMAILRRAVERPHGLVLVSGPTGSGKSTTLYSLLSEFDREKKNVLSLEDPIEYYVDGVIQSQVRPEIGYTFANGLRTTLRQDPDVIMVGEIRDGETAKLAIQAALTGHLVLSTIHTNDAVGVIPRLIDMGVEPYLIPPVLIAAVAQRLVRTLTKGTGKEIPLSPSDRRAIEAQLESLPPQYRFQIPDHVYEPEPTSVSPTGMHGRMAVQEVLEMSPELEKIILTNPVDSELWTAARGQGMLTMQEDAMIKAFAKLIPYSEVNTLSSLMLSEEEEEKARTTKQAPEYSESEQVASEQLTTPSSGTSPQ